MRDILIKRFNEGQKSMKKSLFGVAKSMKMLAFRGCGYNYNPLIAIKIDVKSHLVALIAKNLLLFSCKISVFPPIFAPIDPVFPAFAYFGISVFIRI